jgi:hypothetical protein
MFRLGAFVLPSMALYENASGSGGCARFTVARTWKRVRHVFRFRIAFRDVGGWFSCCDFVSS